MPQKEHAATAATGKTVRPSRPMRVLVVDQDREVSRLLARCVERRSVQLTQASSLAEARRRLADSRVDLALINADLPDGPGVALAGELARAGAGTQTIMIGGRGTYEAVLEAMRAGAVDLLVKPLDPGEVGARIKQAAQRYRTRNRERRRVVRLRRSCRRLNRMRLDVKRQVDTLCRDLVLAYQELAVQMSRVVQCSEYASLVREELDLEGLLRKTLEFLLGRAGPTNVAIFLPSNFQEYALSGYVNYDCASDTADTLLEQLAEVLPPKVSVCPATMHVDDDRDLLDLVGDQLACLSGNHLVAFACRDEDETLAVVVMFRNGDEPFAANITELCDAVAPLLAGALARIIRIHHRHLPDDDADYASDAA